MQYVRVENAAVIDGPRNIPGAWKNISGFHYLLNADLKTHGWYPVVNDTEPVYDPDTERLVLDYYTIRTDDVLKTMKVGALSAEEIQTIADAKQKAADIVANLPTWAQVETAIDNISDLAGAKAFLKKLARVVYWDVKNSAG